MFNNHFKNPISEIMTKCIIINLKIIHIEHNNSCRSCLMFYFFFIKTSIISTC